jgi:hypothetical protein
MPGAARFGRFTVEGRLGVGGMGEVFRARGDEGSVALKLMRPELAADAHHRRLFLAEAQLGARLEHPNLVRQLDAGESHGSLWLALELVDGVSLARVLKSGPLPPEVASYVALELLAALEYVHARALVHRDVSATNVMVSRAGEVKLSDFGVAKAADPTLTRTNEEKGKPAYMAPEQLREHARGPIDGRVDVFAVGVLLYRMTVGEPPFSDVTEWLRAGCPLEPRGPLAPVIVGAMEPAREERFASAAAMALALRACLRPPPRAATELGARVRQSVEAAAPVGDLDRLVIAAELATAAVDEVSSAPLVPSWAYRARRWLPLAGVAAAAALALAAPHGSRDAPLPSSPLRPGELAVPAPPPIAVAPVVLSGTRPTPPSLRPAASAASHAAATRATPAPRGRRGPPPGYLTLDTQPGGTAYLDGKRLGVTPFARVPVPPGRHRVSINVEDSGRWRPVTVNVAPRAETRLAAQLR